MNWKKEFDKVNVCPQRQDALNDQLRDLVHVANRLGFYDAATFINDILKR